MLVCRRAGKACMRQALAHARDNAWCGSSALQHAHAHAKATGKQTHQRIQLLQKTMGRHSRTFEKTRWKQGAEKYDLQKTGPKVKRKRRGRRKKRRDERRTPSRA
eukprot:3635462-Rhodomonas_salina.1